MGLVGDLVIASLAAWRTIVESVVAQTHVDLALAEATVFFAETLGFDGFALHTNVFFGSSSTGAHSTSLPPVAKPGEDSRGNQRPLSGGRVPAFASFALFAVKGFSQR